MKNRMILCLGILLILVMAAADSYAADGPRKKRKKHAADTVLVIVRDTVQMTDTMYVPYDFMEKTCPEVVRPGIEVLEMMDFAPLKGKRVGLVTNPSGVDRNLRSTIDILYNADGVELVALFGPEHGVRGDVYAGGKVHDVVDKTTGLPVYSLYGATRKPTPEMLEGIDVMVYDIQDVGARSYTFISTLGLVIRHNRDENLCPFCPLPYVASKVFPCFVAFHIGCVRLLHEDKDSIVEGIGIGKVGITGGKVVKYALLLVLPLLVIAVGIWINYRRRRK